MDQIGTAAERDAGFASAVQPSAPEVSERPEEHQDKDEQLDQSHRNLPLRAIDAWIDEKHDRKHHDGGGNDPDDHSVARAA